ncbi:MAG: hypothetical protein ACE5H1_01485, partial [Thermodesulfobacteriota bacterium]
MRDPNKMKIEDYNIPCHICDQRNWRADLIAASILRLPDRFRILKCKSCGFMKLSPYLSPDKLNVLYADRYFD